MRLHVVSAQQEVAADDICAEFAPGDAAVQQTLRSMGRIALLRGTADNSLCCSAVGSVGDGETVAVVLAGAWADCEDVPHGSVVHAVGYSTLAPRLLAVRDTGAAYLIVNPDVLLAGTVVGGSFWCLRKTVLESRYHALIAATAEETTRASAATALDPAKAQRAAVFGKILHGAIEDCLVEHKTLTEPALTALLRQRVLSSVAALALVNETDSTAMQTLLSLVPDVCKWAKQALPCRKTPAAPPTPPIMVSMQDGQRPVPVDIEDIATSEESIWSPLFGLKGKLDLVVRARFGAAGPSSVSTLEIKTGREHASHRAQVLLYLLLLHDRYGVPLEQAKGLVLYLPQAPQATAPVGLRGTTKMVGVPFVPHEVRDIIRQRNRLARFLDTAQPDSAIALPAIAFDASACRRCSCSALCAATARVWNTDSPIPAHLSSTAALLSSSDAAFAAKYDRALALEAAVTVGTRQALWTTTVEQRVADGTCLAHLRLVACVQDESRVWHATFAPTEQTAAVSTAEEQRRHRACGQGEYGVISTHDGHVAVAAGLVASTQKNGQVTGALERPLPTEEQLRTWRCHSKQTGPRRWLIDSIELPATYATLRVCSHFLWAGKHAERKFARHVCVVNRARCSSLCWTDRQRGSESLW